MSDRIDLKTISATEALSDLIDAIDNVRGFIDLEAGCSGEGPVVRACEAIGKPIPPNLAAWLKECESDDRES